MKENFDIDFKISAIFQERLSDFITELNCKRKDLPERIGISKDILIRSLNLGIIPSTKSLIKFADYFSTSIEYLIGLTDNDFFVKIDSPANFQQRIEQLKDENETSFFEIANTLGFSRSLFSSWAKYNYIPSLEIAYIISRHFNVSIDYLLGRTDDRD